MLQSFRTRLRRALAKRAFELERQWAMEDLATACVEAVLQGDWARAQLHASAHRAMSAAWDPKEELEAG